jgi:hypothetical protein
LAKDGVKRDGNNAFGDAAVVDARAKVTTVDFDGSAEGDSV